MSEALFLAYQLWTAENGLPDVWPDILIEQHVQTLDSSQRAEALAFRVLMGPEPAKQIERIHIEKDAA